MPERPSSRPGKLLLTFALAMAGVAVFTVLDARQRADLEKVAIDPAVAETALHDDAWFPNPKAVILNSEVVRLDEKPLYRLFMTYGEKRSELLLRVGRDASDRYWIYRETKPEGSSSEPDPNRYFLKIGPGEFLQLTDIAPPGV